MLLRDDKKRHQARKPVRSRIAGMRRQLHSLLFRWSWNGALFASGLAMKAGSGHADPGSLARQGSWADPGGIPLQSRFQLGGWRKATGFGSVGLRLLSIRPWTPQRDCRSDAWRRQAPDGSQGDRCLESFLALASAEALFAGLEPVLMEWRRKKAKTKKPQG